MNKGENIPPRGQSLPLGARFTPRGKPCCSGTFEHGRIGFRVGLNFANVPQSTNRQVWPSKSHQPIRSCAFCHSESGLPDLSWHNIPKRGQYTILPLNYQMSIKYVYQLAIICIGQMSLKYVYQDLPLHDLKNICPNLAFWFENWTSGNPAQKSLSLKQRPLTRSDAVVRNCVVMRLVAYQIQGYQVGRLFTWGRCLKITKVGRIFGFFFPRKKYRLFFLQNMGWATYILVDFSQTHLVNLALFRTHYNENLSYHHYIHHIHTYCSWLYGVIFPYPSKGIGQQGDQIYT
jgi:hypothetical protein